MNKNIPPFHTGQKVVCVKGHSEGAVTKGRHYTITGVYKPCCIWVVTVGVVSPSHYISGFSMCDCGNVSQDGLKEWPVAACRFCAITEDFQAITFSEVMERELTCVN